MQQRLKEIVENVETCMQQRFKEIMENVENAAKKQGTCLKCRKMQ